MRGGRGGHVDHVRAHLAQHRAMVGEPGARPEPLGRALRDGRGKVADRRHIHAGKPAQTRQVLPGDLPGPDQGCFTDPPVLAVRGGFPTASRLRARSPCGENLPIEPVQRGPRRGPGITIHGELPRRLSQAPGQTRFPSSRTTDAANASGSSAMRRSRPGTASMPSAPRLVETMALPIAIPSTILRRVPPPKPQRHHHRGGRGEVGPQVLHEPGQVTRGPARSSTERGGRDPMILQSASGRTAAMRGQISR